MPVGSSLVAERLFGPDRFGLVDLLLAEPEMVAELVDDRLADHADDVVLVLGVFQTGIAEDHDPVRHFGLSEEEIDEAEAIWAEETFGE